MIRFIFGFALGGVLGVGVALGPHSVNGFIVRPKTACLTPEGTTFKIDYVGRGTAVFKLLPPESPQQKEKK